MGIPHLSLSLVSSCLSLCTGFVVQMPEARANGFKQPDVAGTDGDRRRVGSTVVHPANSGRVATVRR